MKRILATAAAAALLAQAGIAFAADSATGTVGLSATAPNTCAIRGVTPGTTTGASTLTGAGTAGTTDATATSVSSLTGAAIGYSAGNLFNPTTAATNSITDTFNVSGFCNYGNHQVLLRSANGGMTNPFAAPTTSTNAANAFAQRVAYTAVLSGWGGLADTADLTATGPINTSAASQDTTSGAETLSAGGVAVNTSTAVLTVTTTAYSAQPALAGTYSDTLTIRLGQAFP